MAQRSNGARPSARVLFIVPEGGRAKSDQDGGGREDKFVEVAAAWLTDRGSYRFTLDSIPARLMKGESVTFILSPIREDEPAASDSTPAPKDNRNQPRGKGGR